MNDLLARIKAEKWSMLLFYFPNQDNFICMLDGNGKSVAGKNVLHEKAIVEAIEEMDRCAN